MSLFTIDAATRLLYQNSIDTLIAQLGRPSKFYLSGPSTQCPNCTFDGSALKSCGIYNGWGPRRFQRPPCPVCKGSGYDPAAEIVETYTVGIQRNIKPNKVFSPQFLETIDVPATIVQIRGTVDQIPAVQTCLYAVLDYQNAVYSAEKYILLDGTKPRLDGSIVAGRYYIAYFRQVE
jgi:hypothetical protein